MKELFEKYKNIKSAEKSARLELVDAAADILECTVYSTEFAGHEYFRPMVKQFTHQPRGIGIRMTKFIEILEMKGTVSLDDCWENGEVL